MPVEKISNEPEIDGKIWTDFKTTPLMSTYLVTFLVSDFKNITNEYGNFSVWSRKNALDSMMIAYENGQKVVHALEEYTNIPYMLPKQDHVEVPNIISAIENWGLLSYR